MAFFRYTAIDTMGQTKSGFSESRDVLSLENSLSMVGYQLISVKEINDSFAKIIRKLNARHIKRLDIIEFASNLSMMLKAGVPLLLSLEDIISTLDNKYLKGRVLSIQKSISLGSTFTNAISDHQDVFPDIFIRLVAVGEETGTLEKCLDEIAEHLKRLEALMASLKRSVIYPIFVLIATTGALLFWLIYVLPKILSFLQEMDIPLPMPTRIMIAVTDFTVLYWYLFLAVPVFLYTLLLYLKRYENIRYMIDQLKLKLPIIKYVVQDKIVALFTEQMRILLSAGLAIVNSLEITSKHTNSLVLRNAIISSIEAIQAGATISEALRQHNIFPNLVIRLIDTGEKTGKLEEQLAFLSQHFTERLDDKSQKLAKLFEPLSIAILGLFFLAVIVSLMLPIFDIVSNIK